MKNEIFLLFIFSFIKFKKNYPKSKNNEKVGIFTLHFFIHKAFFVKCNFLNIFLKLTHMKVILRIKIMKN